MSQQTCTVCASNVRDTFICRRCAEQTRYHLADLPEHALQLHVALQKMTHMGAANDGGKAADPALTWQGIGDQFLDDVGHYLKTHPIMRPYGKLAGDLLRETRVVLLRWALSVQAEIPAKYSIPVLSAYILRHFRELTRDPAVGQLVTKLKDLTNRIMAAIDVPADKAKFVAGPCVEQVEGQYCPGVVIARLPASEGWGQKADDANRPTLTCSVSRKVWYAESFHKIGPPIARRRDELMAAKLAALTERHPNAIQGSHREADQESSTAARTG